MDAHLQNAHAGFHDLVDTYIIQGFSSTYWHDVSSVVPSCLSHAGLKLEQHAIRVRHGEFGAVTMSDISTPVLNFTPYKEKRGEEYMNDKQVEHFRGILQGWKKELMEEVDRTLHHMQDDAANFPDPNDRATQESEFALELRTRDRERKLIKKIDEALSTLDTREYGYCETCGVEIGIRRLEARPTATLCIDCKVLDEIREKQMG